MQLDRITAQVRPRTPWEAMDVGFLMVRAWWKPIFGAWCLTVVPTAALITAAVIALLGWDWWGLALVLVWWLKPVYDLIPLHVASRALFGATPTVREVLRALPGLLGAHVFWYLTLFRIDPARSFALPVWLLEGLRGQARSERARVLNKTARGSGISIGVLGLHFEWVVQFGVVGLVWLLVPDPVLENGVSELILSDDPLPVVSIFYMCVYIFVVTVVEPFYAVAGFALYLNRRTHLEAWDIELAFRRLEQRTQTGVKPASGAGVGKVALVLCGVALTLNFATSDPAWAATTARTESLSLEDAKRRIDEIMATDEFRTTEEHQKWVYTGDRTWESEPDINMPNPEQTEFNHAMAVLLEVLLWVAAVLAVVWLAYHFLSQTGAAAATDAEAPDRPKPVPEFGALMTTADLPDDVASAAWAAWQAGRQVEAMSLLYRGALRSLSERRGLRFALSATEADCVRTVARHAEPPVTEYFHRLTRAWQFLAYAHRPPAGADMQALCAEWRKHFQGDAA